MEADRQADLLDLGPEGVVEGQVVGLLWRVRRHEDGAIKITAKRAMQRERNHQSDKEPVPLLVAREQRLFEVRILRCPHFPGETNRQSEVVVKSRPTSSGG